MTYLLYGSDINRSLEKLKDITAEFQKKNPHFNIHKFDAEEDDLALIKNAIETESLFAAKKLVIIKYVSLGEDPDAIYLVVKKAKGSPNTVIVLWDRELGADYLRTIRPYCDKIQEFKEPRVREVPAPDIFRLGDTFFTSRREGLRNLLELLDSGHDDFNLFSYLVNHSRTLATVKSYLSQNKPVPANSGIHPYVVKKASSAVRALPEEAPQSFLRRFFEEDHKIKVGQSKPKESLINILLG